MLRRAGVPPSFWARRGEITLAGPPAGFISPTASVVGCGAKAPAAGQQGLVRLCGRSSRGPAVKARGAPAIGLGE